MNTVLDDRLLIEELLVGMDVSETLFTTSYWYYRACRAALVGAGGHLSGPFAGLSHDDQGRAIAAMMLLPERIGLPDPRVVVPVMVDIARRHPQLNLLNLEAAATARVLDAVVWLSPQSASGILPAVLEDQGTPWVAVEPGPP